MRAGSALAAILFAIAAVFLIYSLVITPRMDSGVEGQGYRPPVQDLTPPKNQDKQPPLQNSNVPPTTESSK